MPSGPNTPKLNLLRVQENWQFGDDSFNKFIDDADDKLLGVAHEDSTAHWFTWQPDTVYNVGDVVRIANSKSHQYYQCTKAGTSGSITPTNNVTGSVVNDNDVQWLIKSLSDEEYGAAIKIWLAGNRYIKGDAVIYGTALYRCKVTHDSSTWANDYIRWQEIFASIRAFYPNIYYFAGDTVIRDNLIWYCLTAHMSAASWTPAEKTNWLCLNDGRILDWKPSTTYTAGDIIISDNIMYRCIADHTSDSTSFSNDRVSKWTLFHDPNATIRNWSAGKYYQANQMVMYGGVLYRCNNAHTSTTFNADIANWDIVFANIPIWEAGQAYKIGATVINDNKLYRCKTAHISTTFTADASNWDNIGVEPLTTTQLNAVIDELKA